MHYDGVGVCSRRAGSYITVKVEEVFAASVAPDKLTVSEPAVAVMVPPPHDPVSPLGFATVIPASRVSVKLTVKSETVVLGFATVKLRLDTPFIDIVFGANDLVMVGVSVTAKVTSEGAGNTQKLQRIRRLD